MNRRQIFTFIAVLVAISWVGQFIVLYLTNGLANEGATVWLLPIMFTPSLCALVYLFMHREYWRYVRWRPGRIRYLVAAPLIPAVLGLIVIAVVSGIGWGHSEYFEFQPAGVRISSGPWLLGTGSQNWLLFAANYGVTAVVYAAVSGLATIGEEFGWRGFLQPVMIEQFGVTSGVVVIGLVWALWHVPIILAGYNYPDHPVLGALVLFPLLLTGASFLLAWITLKAGSFWPAVLVHGAINSIYQGVTGDRLQIDVARLNVDVLLAAMFVLVGVLCWALLRDLRGRDPGTGL